MGLQRPTQEENTHLVAEDVAAAAANAVEDTNLQKMNDIVNDGDETVEFEESRAR